MMNKRKKKKRDVAEEGDDDQELGEKITIMRRMHEEKR